MSTATWIESEVSHPTSESLQPGPREALIVGRAPSLMWAVPYLLSRSGFAVDVITTTQLLKASRFVRDVQVVDTQERMIEAAYERVCFREKPYDWVIAGDDMTALELSGLPWPDDAKPQHLSLRIPGEVSHLFSKIGLSRVLSDAGIQTPAFCVALSSVDAAAAAHKLGYPVLVKTDAGSGGSGVFTCNDDSDVLQMESMFTEGPLLVQKKIAGEELDLAGIFFNAELVHFTYSKIEKVLAENGLSVVRTYNPLPLVEEQVFTELRAVGKALQATGFASITCIDAADGSGRYYFEADMRPNIWVDFSRYFGEDAAERICNWFERGEVLKKEKVRPAIACKPVTMAHFMRVSFWDLAVNRYGVRKFISWAERRVVLNLLWSRAVMPGARAFVPRKIRRVVKRGMIALRIAFP